MIPIVSETEPSMHLDMSTHKTVSETEDTNVSETEDTHVSKSEAEDTNVSETEDANVSEVEDKAAQMIEETRSANILTPEVIQVASSVDDALSDGDVSA
jgi:molybdopterin converting factor small subunit